jgi:hypothetical protein
MTGRTKDAKTISPPTSPRAIIRLRPRQGIDVHTVALSFDALRKEPTAEAAKGFCSMVILEVDY